MQTLFKDLPEALENNYHFPFRFNYKLKKSTPALPTINILNKLSENEELLRLSKIGLKNRLDNFVIKKQDFLFKS